MHVRLVEARADTQLGLGREDGHFGIGVAMQVHQASGAQCAPHTSKPGADDQNALFHVCLLEERGIAVGTSKHGHRVDWSVAWAIRDSGVVVPMSAS
ncbi:hypothetical protein D3C81_1721380 [compost metagenome]